MSKETEALTDFDLDNFSWDEELITPIDTQEPGEEGEGADNSDKGGEEVKTSKTTVVTGLNEKGQAEETEEGDSKQAGGQAKKDDSNAGTGTGESPLQLFRERGIIDFEDEELSAEDFDEEEFLNTKLEEKLENKLESLLSKMPQGLKDMIRYSAKGGDFMEVVKDLTTPTELSADIDLEVEDNQKRVVQASMRKEGKSSEQIQEYIEFLEFKGKLASEAKSLHDKFLTEEETREERRLENHKQEIAKRNQRVSEDIQSAEDLFKEKTETFGGMRFTKTEKKDLPGYVYSPTVELEDGRVTTPFNYELLQALKDKEKTMFLAKIVKSGFKIENFVKDMENKVVNRVENNLQGVQGKGSSQSNSPKTHLVDFL